MKRLFTLWLLVITIQTASFSQGFLHPGALHTEEDFVRIKEQLATGEPRVVQGYENLKASEWSQSNVATWPVETIKRGIAGDENYMNAARGAAAAYQNALRWKISGDEAHAERAVYILNAWASVCTGVSGNTNMSLASGLYGYAFANAAELMRDYEGWHPDDFKKFQDFMLYVFYPRAIDFLQRRHDTWDQGRPGHYWANWGLCNALAVMSIGILCDDVYIYNEGVSYYKYDYVGTFTEERTPPLINDGLTEFLGNMIPVVFPDERGPYGYVGQSQESGRDQGHTVMLFGLAIDIAQIGWNQGDDLFAHMDNRLAAGIEWTAAYNRGVDDLPWMEYWYHDVRTALHNSWKQLGPNAHARGQMRPYWDRVVGHYEGIKGVEMPYSKEMAYSVDADWGGVGGTSGGYDHLGFSTLTCTRPAVTPEQAPTSLKTIIDYGGETYYRGELSGVEPGSTVKFIPLLPGDETDTGNWNWETGDATKELEVTVDSSRLYRVTYTNSNGVESRQLFSVAVVGDSSPDRITPVIRVGGEVIHDTTIVVKQFSRLDLEVWSAMGYGSFKWSTGSTSHSINIEMEDEDRVIDVIATNPGGNEALIRFYIEVETLGAGYIIDDEPLVNSNKAAVSPGQRVELIPLVKSGMENGSWKWDDESTSKNKVLENVQENKKLTVTYSLDTEEYQHDFFVYVLPIPDAWGYWPMDEPEGSVAYDIWRGRDAEIIGGLRVPGIVDGGVRIFGTDGSYINLPEDIVNNLTDFTISVWVKPEAQANWARVWDFGRGSSHNMFLTTNSGGADQPVRFAIKAGGSEQQINTSHILETNQYVHLAVVKTGNVGVIYVNGEEAGRNSNITLNPSDLGYTTQNYIGKSQYPDPNLRGIIDDLRIYNSALDGEEVMELVNMAIPDAPQNLAATVVSGNVELTWDEVPGATGYIVKRSGEPGGPFSNIRINLRSTNYSHRNVTEGETFYYLVTAENNGFESDYSNVVSVLIASTSIHQALVRPWYVHPNPVKDHLNIVFEELLSGPTEIRILNLQGSVLINERIEGVSRYLVDMSGMTAGIYVLEVVGNDFPGIQNEKIVKI